MQTSELDAALLTQLQSLTLNQHATIYVAFSGGLDSACLLHALARLHARTPFTQNIAVLHVHHGLSENADGWLAFCEQQTKQCGFEFNAHKVILSGRGSIEDQARESRYEVFRNKLSLGDVLLMAHHSDDQVETFMLRLMRGSGLTGLSAMEVKRNLAKGVLLRPWLNFSRKSLEQYKTQHNVQHIEDESNLDEAFDRNWWRHDLLPKLNARFKHSQTSILKTIKVLQQENQLLQELLEPIYYRAVGQDADDSTTCTSLSTSHETLSIDVLMGQSENICLQILRMWLAKQNIYPRLNEKQLAKIWHEVALAKVDANPKFCWQGHEVRRYQKRLYVMDALPAVDVSKLKAQPYKGESLSLLAGELLCESSAQGLKPDEYQLGFYQGGLKAKPLGQSTKTLKKWMMAHNIPPWIRPFWPVLHKDGQVAGVPGLFVCEGFAAGLSNNSPQDRPPATIDTGWQLNFTLNLPKK
jgi:tRNA(Ile)-lysidine synthase